MRLLAKIPKTPKTPVETNRFMQATFDVMSKSHAMVWYDPKGNIRSANALFCELTVIPSPVS